MKGIRRPMFRLSSEAFRISAIGRDFRISPKEPPAPVMTRMEADWRIPSDIQLKELPFSFLGMRKSAKPMPRIRAVTGFPTK
jgi:hypothetical protein